VKHEGWAAWKPGCQMHYFVGRKSLCGRVTKAGSLDWLRDKPPFSGIDACARCKREAEWRDK
jgi:hypothetical protein